MQWVQAKGPGRSALHGRRVFLRSGAFLAGLYQWSSEAWGCCVRGRRRGSDECGRADGLETEGSSRLSLRREWGRWS